MNIKINKNLPINKHRILFLIVTLLYCHQSYAGIEGVRSQKSSGSTGSNTSVVVKQGKVKDKNVVLNEGIGSESCDRDQGSSTYFPLDFFKNISSDGSSLSFEIEAVNKIHMKMPMVINVCGKFKPQLYQDPNSKNITILMQTEDKKTYSQYIECLTQKNFLIDNKIDHDKIDGKFYSEYSTDLDYSFEKSKDIKKSIKLSYGYPIAFKGKDGYGPAFGLDKDVELPLCMLAEKVQMPTTYINKGQDVIIEELNAKCRTGDAQIIAEARKSLGNAEALKDVFAKVNSELEAGYLVAAEKDVDKVFDSMTKIEKRLSTDGDSIDETKARKLTKEYADLAKNLDSVYLNPAITRLDNLMRKVEGMDQDDSQKEDVYNEIKKINVKIGEFSTRKNAFPQVYSVMEKYSINDSAKVIEDIRLKSFYYGKVSPSGVSKGAISFDDANSKQVKGLKRFESTLNDWDDQYQVGKGNLNPIKKIEKERNATNTRMNARWSTYVQNEQQSLQKYCGTGMLGSMNNPVQCRSFQAGAKQRMDRELNNRTKDLRYIQGRSDKLTKMSAGYNKYQAGKVNEDAVSNDSEDPYDSPYSNYDDNFNDKYPGYYGNQNPTPYNPALYNLGTPGVGMMGNNGGGYPNAQMPMQQGQYQMNQGGAWPGM